MRKFLDEYRGRWIFSKKYRLNYLPLFYDDIDEKVTYIAEKLKNIKRLNSYYVFTTFNYINMLRFAIFVTFLTISVENTNLANRAKTRQIKVFQEGKQTWFRYFLSATATSWNILGKSVKSMVLWQGKALTIPLIHHFLREPWNDLDYSQIN